MITTTGQQQTKPQTTQQLALTLYSRLLFQKSLIRDIQDDTIPIESRSALLGMLTHVVKRRRQTAEALGIAHLSLGEQERVAYLMTSQVTS